MEILKTNYRNQAITVFHCVKNSTKKPQLLNSQVYVRVHFTASELNNISISLIRKQMSKKSTLTNFKIIDV